MWRLPVLAVAVCVCGVSMLGFTLTSIKTLRFFARAMPCRCFMSGTDPMTSNLLQVIV